MSLFFNTIQSLQYTTQIGDIGTPRVFPVNNLQSNYLSAEQAFEITAYGLKPYTYHTLYLDSVDVTSSTKQEGYALGERSTLFSDENGKVVFKFYFKTDLIPSTPVEKSSSYAQLIAGTKKLQLKDSSLSSFAEMYIYLPPYIRNEPTVTFKKNPISTSTGSIQNNLTVQTTPVVSASAEKTYFTPPTFNVIQTFYADPEIVKNQKDVSITSIDLFFKAKPNNSVNLSGKKKPSVSIAICEVQNDTPILSRCYTTSLTEKIYDEINAYSDASTPASFTLSTPLKLSTGKFYGVVVIFDDPSYQLWTNVVGDKLVGTNKPSSGSNIIKDGKLYVRNNSNIFTSKINEDLKFNVNISRYTTNSAKKIFVNDNYEFFTIKNRSGTFISGEYAYKDVSPATGTVKVVKGSNILVGSGGTAFDTLKTGQAIVVGNSTVSQVGFVSSVIDSNNMILTNKMPFDAAATNYKVTAIGKVYYKDEINNKLYLSQSTANTGLLFAVNDLLVGEDSRASANIASIDNYSIDRIKLKGTVKAPTSSKVNTSITFAALSSGSYTVNNKDLIQINDTRVKDISAYDAYILSRSNEVVTSGLYTNNDLLIYNKSLNISLDLNTSASDTHSAPTIENNILHLYSIQNLISNTYTTVNANGVTIDTEIAGNGSALCRHMGSKIIFAEGRSSEDVKVYMTAYRPLGTDIKVYARVHNSEDPEAFDDKAWTPLTYDTNSEKYSSTKNDKDFIEYELSLPLYSESANTLPGTFTTSINSNTIFASGVTPNTYVSTGDLIKIYDRLLPTTNYFVATVSSANSTAINLDTEITTNNVNGEGFKVDNLKYKNIAFNNVNNYNIARYYNATMAEFDTFDSMQIKIVLLSDTSYLTPKVDLIQVIGVSA
jgi:hypothetical protein